MEANNNAASEALKAINCIDTRGLKYLLCELVEADIFDGGLINKTISAIEKAKCSLSKPLRNCDIGSEEEQSKRFDKFCHLKINPQRCCSDCPAFRTTNVDCELVWAQMPYEKEDNDGSK